MDERGLQISSGPLTHSMIRSQPLRPLAYAVRGQDPGLNKAKISVLTCQCTSNHKNSKGAFGCGASWLIGAEFNLADKKPEATLHVVTEDEEDEEDVTVTAVWPVAAAYATTASSSLKTVQASAKTWQAALTAILGLVAVVSLVGGRSTLQTLSGATQAWIVTLAAIAVVANAVGIYQSTLSSIGFPAIKKVAGAVELSNSDLWPLRQTIQAAGSLRAALGWSAVAFVFGAAAIGVVWLAPPAAAPAAKVDLTVLQPTPAADPTATVPVAVCGALASPQPTGSPASIAIVPSTTASPAPTVTYPMTSVAGIAPGTC
jgi:hypothetical protein